MHAMAGAILEYRRVLQTLGRAVDLVKAGAGRADRARSLLASEAHAWNARRPAACGVALGMALGPAVLEARIDLRVCEDRQ
jgi:hypothetical protein